MRASRLALVAVALILAVACSSGSSTTSTTPTSSKKTLVVGAVLEPPTLDVTANAAAGIAEALRDNVYEGLVRTDPKGKILPQLARSYDISADGRTVTFHLVSARWHDGSPFTAADVKFSWERAMDKATTPPNPHRDYWAPVDAITVVDDHTVKVALKQYSDSWLFHMAQGSAAILSPKSIAADKDTPVGTGPFRFSRWNRGDSIVLVRNENYWGPKAPLQQVTFKYITDANAMNNALTAGDVDAISAVTGPEQLAAFSSSKGFKVLEGKPSGKIIVAMNNGSGATKDLKVRQAISYALDRKAFIDGVYLGHATAIGTHAVPNDSEPYYLDLTGTYKPDRARARQLLSEAGFASGLSLRLSLPPPAYARRGGEILASQLAEVGIKVQTESVEFPLWLDKVFGKANYDLTIINHVEPRDIGNYGNSKYYWRYDNPQVADQLSRADAEPDAKKRNDLYGQAEKQISQDAVNVWVMSPDSLAVIKSSLKGYPESRIAPSIYLGQAYFG